MPAVSHWHLFISAAVQATFATITSAYSVQRHHYKFQRCPSYLAFQLNSLISAYVLVSADKRLLI